MRMFICAVIATLIVSACEARATVPAPPPKKKPPVYVQEVWQQQQQMQSQGQGQSVSIDNRDARPPAYAPSLSLTAHNCIGSINGVVGVGGVVSGGVGWTRVHSEACAMEWALKCLAFQRLRGRTWVNTCVDQAFLQAKWSKPLSNRKLRRAMKLFDEASKDWRND